MTFYNHSRNNSRKFYIFVCFIQKINKFYTFLRLPNVNNFDRDVKVIFALKDSSPPCKKNWVGRGSVWLFTMFNFLFTFDKISRKATNLIEAIPDQVENFAYHLTRAERYSWIAKYEWEKE